MKSLKGNLMFQKIGKKQKITKNYIQASAKDKNETFQTRFLNNTISKEVIYHSSSNLKHLGMGKFKATSDDPNFLLRLPVGQKALSISFNVQSENADCLSVLYFSYNKKKQFSENNKLILGKTDGQEHVKHLVFPTPIYWLRLDPVDSMENFVVIKMEIHLTSDNIPASLCEEVKKYQKLSAKDDLKELRKKANDQMWQISNTVVFITHEVSGTGAPLLCRKMSASARRGGMHTVIMSLNDSEDTQMVQYFSDDCDTLLICRNNEEIRHYSMGLSAIGMRCAVLNSVASGAALRHFHDAGFKTVCLIHEMYSALKILQVERWMEDYSLYADKVVFPATCVRDEFIHFGGKISEKAVVIPQGYYKGIFLKADSKNKVKTMKKLGIPDGAKIIIGTGSINFLKGVDLLLLIARELQRRVTAEYHFLWLGTSNDERYNIGLQNQMFRMKLVDRFHLIGYVSDDTEYMNLLAMCDAFALVSREDSYPSVLIEAMACEVPVVAFRESGGAQDLLADGRGFLIDYMDIRKYAQILDYICHESVFANNIKARAKKHIMDKCDFDDYVKHILMLI